MSWLPGPAHRPRSRLVRLIAAALLLAAVLPVLGVGVLLYVRLGTALDVDARLRAEQAAVAARALVARSVTELSRLVDSYARWPQLAAAVSAGELDAVRMNVLDFLVEEGQLSGAVLVAGERSVAAGSPTLTAAIRGDLAAGTTGTAVRALGNGVYLVAVAPLADPAAPTEAAPPLARLGFARRLDAEFAVELRGLTGFDVAVVASDGRLAVATNPDAVAGLGRLDELPTSGERSSILFVRVPLGDVSVPAAELILSTSLPAAQAATGQLPALVAALAGAAVLAAALLALWLSRILARRLAAVHAGLLAIADGRRPPVLSTTDDDPIDHLVIALDRLRAALDRRETTVRRSFEAVASVPIDRPPEQVAARLLDAADDIFDLRWSVILQADGRPFARSGRTPSDEDPGSENAFGGIASAGLAALADRPDVVVAELDPRPTPQAVEVPPSPSPSGWADSGAEVESGRRSAGRRLVAALPVSPRPRPAVGNHPAWTPADEATLRLMAILIGSAVEDAERYATAAERALRLDRLNQLQRQFLRSISHNLKTPLTTIGLAVDDLAEAVGDDPYLARRTQAIRSEAARLGRLVEQVLTLSRLEAGTVDLSDEMLVPADVVARIWQELDVERTFRIDDRTERRAVLADRRALEQIVWNLLDNAVRYAPTGAVEVRLELRPVASTGSGPGGRHPRPPTARAPAAELELAVLDEGPGVPPGERGRIFHRFARGSTAGRQAGTGLGLSLARSLARLMGGDVVYVDRGTGSGACFVARLPVVTAASGTVPLPGGSVATAPGERSIGRPSLPSGAALAPEQSATG